MSEVGAHAYLIGALMEAGPTAQTAMGERPLGWPDVLAFSQATLAVEEPWELRLLHAMSREYLGARLKAEDPLARAPVDQADPLE